MPYDELPLVFKEYESHCRQYDVPKYLVAHFSTFRKVFEAAQNKIKLNTGKGDHHNYTNNNNIVYIIIEFKNNKSSHLTTYWSTRLQSTHISDHQTMLSVELHRLITTRQYSYLLITYSVF